MKIICNQNELSKAINIVQKAIPSRSTSEILTGIFIEAKDHKLILTGNDGKLGIETFIHATVEEEGYVVVPSKLFGDFIKKLPNENIDIEIIDNKLSIYCNKSHIDMICFDNKNDYPTIKNIDNNEFFSLNKMVFENMIKKVLFAISKDESRPILTGAYLEIMNHEISLVGIDGFRVALNNFTIDTEIETKIVIPDKTISNVYKIISSEDSEEEIKIFVSNRNILFEFNNVKIVSNLLDGEYIKYKSMIPTDFKTKITVKREQLLSSVDRIALISRESKNKFIKFNIIENKLKLSSFVQTGYGEDFIDVKKEGEDLSIAFNPDYILDFLKITDSDYIEMKFISKINPCIMNPKNDDSYTYLILPIRIPDEN